MIEISYNNKQKLAFFSALLLSVLLLSLYLPCLDAALEFGGRYKHVDSQVLPVKGVLVGVEKVTDNDGSVDYHTTGQLDWVSHQRVHQRICGGTFKSVKHLCHPQ